LPRHATAQWASSAGTPLSDYFLDIYHDFFLYKEPGPLFLMEELPQAWGVGGRPLFSATAAAAESWETEVRDRLERGPKGAPLGHQGGPAGRQTLRPGHRRHRRAKGAASRRPPPRGATQCVRARQLGLLLSERFWQSLLAGTTTTTTAGCLTAGAAPWVVAGVGRWWRGARTRGTGW
jgi:hypothetical protein